MRKLALLFVLVSATSFAQVKNVLTSNIQWWGYKLAKMEATSHTGTIDLKSGNVIMRGNQVVGGTFVLDMTSLTSTDLKGEDLQKLNGHLKSGDFFETNAYPTATFKITSIKKNNNKKFNSIITGNLTAKNKTGKISFPANINVSNGTVSIFSDKFNFDRQKYDVAFKSRSKDVVINDDIDMLINLTAK